MGKNDVVGIENVANLDNVPESGSMIYVPVLNIFEGSGGPARVFAAFDDESNKNDRRCHPDQLQALCRLIRKY